MSNSCIRVYADRQQLQACREYLAEAEDRIKDVARLLKLAGNEVRLKILYLIYREGEMCPCDLSDVLGMTVPAISQHLRKLKDGGLLADNKIGQTIYYHLVAANSEILLPLLTGFDEKKIVNE
ncbi:MAG TPA: ArsR family transcriptional regulator [Flammeovirgaceae bacterium]|nr:ArsR family transcriptional regulator [Flammeovirgaceae bacterium]